LPTPKATDADRGGRGDLLQVARGNPSPSGHFKMLPTPTAKANMMAPSMQKWAAHRNLWPTPSARDHKDTGEGRYGRGQLPEAVRETWPTPTQGDAIRGAGRSAHESNPGPNLRTQAGGALNPAWVEWLMGFPPGWTDCGASATRSSRRSPSGSANASSSTKGRSPE
jgi:hypothetical protein